MLGEEDGVMEGRGSNTLLSCPACGSSGPVMAYSESPVLLATSYMVFHVRMKLEAIPRC